MFFDLVLPKLELYAPLAIVGFAVLLILFAEVSRWLRQRRSLRRVWIEIVALAVALALVVTLIDWLVKR